MKRSLSSLTLPSPKKPAVMAEKAPFPIILIVDDDQVAADQMAVNIRQLLPEAGVLKFRKAKWAYQYLELENRNEWGNDLERTVKKLLNASSYWQGKLKYALLESTKEKENSEVSAVEAAKKFFPATWLIFWRSKMPKLSAIEFLQLNEHENKTDAPVIIMIDEGEDTTDFYANGAADIITVPVNVSSLENLAAIQHFVPYEP